MKLGGGQSWPRRSHLNISARVNVKFMNILHIKILISKTYIKISYHILQKNGGRDKCKLACVQAKCDYSSFPKLFLSLNTFKFSKYLWNTYIVWCLIHQTKVSTRSVSNQTKGTYKNSYMNSILNYRVAHEMSYHFIIPLKL